jgi:hypothetical protein
MRAPVVIVTAALTVAILLSASLLIVTGTRGEDAASPVTQRIMTSAPAKAGHSIFWGQR